MSIATGKRIPSARVSPHASGSSLPLSRWWQPESPSQAGSSWTARKRLPASRRRSNSASPPPAAGAHPGCRGARVRRGRTAEARRRFETILGTNPSSIPAAVGAAVASWPAGTVERLRDLAREHPSSARPLAPRPGPLRRRGKEEAGSEWLEAEEGEPDTPAALRAEDLLHPEMAPADPSSPSRDGVGADLAEARRRAESRRGTGPARLWGRPPARRAAGVRADGLRQGSRGRPAKPRGSGGGRRGALRRDAPEEAFSRLGPLARDHPVVRFHLGLLLLWIVQSTRPAGSSSSPRRAGFYAREAQRLLRGSKK